MILYQILKQKDEERCFKYVLLLEEFHFVDFFFESTVNIKLLHPLPLPPNSTYIKLRMCEKTFHCLGGEMMDAFSSVCTFVFFNFSVIDK